MFSHASEILSSTIFVLIGSIAFHVSAMISGYNIYREKSQYVSTLITATAGIIIFFLSPVSFIIIYPCEIDIPSIDDTLISIKAINAIWDVRNICTFLQVTLGMGLVFGAFTFLKIRIFILRWFSVKACMQFSLHTYQNAWDSFLGMIKSGGELIIDIGDKKINGTIYVFSSGDEPRELVVSGVNRNDSVNEGDKIFIPGAVIKNIIVPSYSFGKHNEESSHTTQSFYSLISSVGFILLSFGVKNTSEFIGSKADTLNIMAQNYDKIAFILYVAAIIMLCSSALLSVKDFKYGVKGWIASIHIFPITAVTVICGLILYTFNLRTVIENLYDIESHHVAYTMFIASIFATIILVIILKMQITLNKFYREIYDLFNDKSKLSKAITTIMMDIDLNSESKINININEILLKYKEDQYISNIINKTNEYINNYKYLSGEYYNMLLRYKSYLDSKR